MKNYLLNNNKGVEFSFLSVTHLIILIFTYIAVILILYNKKKISNICNEQKKKIRIMVGLLLFLILLIRRGSFIYYDVYNWRRHLDLGFCSMTNLIFILYCFIGNKKLYNICYYFVFAGPLLAILFPSVTDSINNFSFLAFVIMHYGLFIFNLIFAIFEKKEYKLKDALIGIETAIIYFLFTNVFNIIFNTYYNSFRYFISDRLSKNMFIQILNNNSFLNILFLIIIGSVMSFSGTYILKILNIGVDKHEKK